MHKEELSYYLVLADEILLLLRENRKNWENTIDECDKIYQEYMQERNKRYVNANME